MKKLYVLNPAFFVLFLATSCVRGPSFFNMEKSSGVFKRTNNSPIPSVAGKEGTQGTTATSKSGSQRIESPDGTVSLEPPAESSVSGTKVSFPPGSIAVDTTVDVEESVPVATSATAAELGLENVSTASKAVVVSSPQKVDPAQPFTVSIDLPSSNLQGNSGNLIVIYKVYSHATSQSLAGVIPASGYVVSAGAVSFKSKYFGSFQAAYTSTPVTAPVEVRTTSSSVLTKADAAVLPKVGVTARTPLVVKAGETVSLSGLNFRPTMVVAMGGKKVNGLKIASDSSASFTSPEAAAMGLVNLTIEQDGVSQTASIIYGGDSNDLPVITMTPDTVCAGTNYYDKNGNKQTGTKSCSSNSPYPPCSTDGQSGCVTSGSFPAVEASSVPAKAISGAVLGGVKGNVLLPTPAKVLSGENFGPSGSLAGSLTLPPATAVVGITGPFGVGGNSVTPAIVTCSTSVTQGCLASAPYHAGVTCSVNSQKNCHLPLTGTFSSADLSNLSPGKIKRGETVAGVVGNFPSSSNPLPRYVDSGTSTATTGSDELDLTNFATQITTDGTFEYWDSSGTRRTGSGDSDLTPTNIKNGVSIAGITGTYPSSVNLLTGADSTADLDTATFDAKIKSAAAFEFFGPDGTRYTNSGATDITAANIASGVTIFGATGSATILTQCTSVVQATCESDTACRWNAGTCEINPWHIRAGITVASKAGSLKTNCRNTINNTYYNWDGSVASLIDTGSTAGTANDFWDTLDDFYGLAPDKVTAWSSNTQCDSTNWTDVTTTNGGISLTTCGTSGTCIYRDELSGLRVTGVLSSGNNTTNTSSPATFTWIAAINACNGSTYGGYAAGTWRLPTQKELMSLNQHAIISRVVSGFHTLPNLQNYYWSSTGNSTNTVNGWGVRLVNGSTATLTKTSGSYAICVF